MIFLKITALFVFVGVSLIIVKDFLIFCYYVLVTMHYMGSSYFMLPCRGGQDSGRPDLTRLAEQDRFSTHSLSPFPLARSLEKYHEPRG